MFESCRAHSFVLVCRKLEIQSPGRRVGARCVKPTNRNRGRKRCTRISAVRGKLVKAGAAGANHFSFNGKVGGHTIGPGRYRLTATPAGGNSRQAKLTILR